MPVMAFGPHAFSPEELVALLAAERRGRPFLAYRDGAGDLRLLPLEGVRWLPIRLEGSDLALDWDAEYRAGTRFEALGERWTVVGVWAVAQRCFLNGERVTGTEMPAPAL